MVVTESQTSQSASGQWSGIGLITGQPVTVLLEQAEAGSGGCFRWPNGDTVRPTLSSVAHTDRGVTLMSVGGQPLSIVEHFLAAMAFCGVPDWVLHLPDGACELPLLDGAAMAWAEGIRSAFELAHPVSPVPVYRLLHPVTVRLNETVCVSAVPAERFSVRYRLDYDHPDIKDQFEHWHYGHDAEDLILRAQTFGWLDELPALQARGLAKGVTLDNTLGLTAEGGYTRPLHFDNEPFYHKMLDCIGDLSLMGINPLQVGMAVTALNAGHTGHIALANALCRHSAIVKQETYAT
jgi:UDP-3-O-[3-hydroxymyristoyl] N-acetylglucosamine deacetylase